MTGVLVLAIQVECEVCHSRVMKDQGLVCDYGHLVCDSCLQGYTHVEKLVQDQGRIRCPHQHHHHDDDDSTSPPTPCDSSPWAMDQVMPHLQPQIQIQLVQGLLQHLRLLEEGSVIMAERLKEQEEEAVIKVMEERKRQHETETKGYKERLKELDEAAARLEEHKLQQYHRDILHQCLAKRVGPSSLYHHRRVKSVISYLNDLTEPSDLKHRVLESCGDELTKLGITIDEVAIKID